MKVLRALFPRWFGSPLEPEGVRDLHRALDEIGPSTEALKQRLDRPDLADVLREARRNTAQPLTRRGQRL